MAVLSVGLPGKAAKASDASDTKPEFRSLPWSEAPLLTALETDSLPRARRDFPVVPSEHRSHQDLTATLARDWPNLDGDLADWPLVRWQDLRGPSTIVRGARSPGQDISGRVALLWSAEGLFMGFETTDDDLVLRRRESTQSIESTLITIATASPWVQRHWRANEMTFRVWADGTLQAWSRLLGRRTVLFDAAKLGARGTAMTLPNHTGSGGKIVYELFVPWDVLFPALPHEDCRLLVNFLIEDIDGSGNKLAALVTAPGERRMEKSWAPLVFEGALHETWILSRSSSHVEAGYGIEWSVIPPATMPEQAAIQLHDERRGETFRIPAPEVPSLLRYVGLEAGDTVWPEDRATRLRILRSPDTVLDDVIVHHSPDASQFSRTMQQLRQNDAEGSPAGGTYPSSADVAVQIDLARQKSEQLGEWSERLYHFSGIPAWRAWVWREVADIIETAERMRRSSEAAATDRNQAGRGLPSGQPVLRGYRSVLDGSVQPYGLFLPDSLRAGESIPLVVMLHDLDEGVLAPFRTSTLAREASRRRWAVVTPFGREDSGFLLAGERDVLDVIEIVRRDLPIDGKRIYVAGHTMGGTGAWLMSLRHPKLFASAAVISGLGDLDQQGFFDVLGYHPNELFYFETQNPVRLVRPELTTPTLIIHSNDDPVISVVHARIMGQKLHEFDIPHVMSIRGGSRIGSKLFEDEISNVFDFFQLHENIGEGVANNEWFRGAGGPVATVFPRGPFAVVYGTQALEVEVVKRKLRPDLELTGRGADERTAQQFGEEWQSVFTGQVRILPDTAVTDDIFRDYNLVLTGDPRTNSIIRRLRDELPVQYAGDGFHYGSRSFEYVDFGIAYAAPNSKSPGRSVIVLSGMADRLGGFRKSLLKLGADYVVSNDLQQVADLGHFSSFVGIQPRKRLLEGGN